MKIKEQLDKLGERFILFILGISSDGKTDSESKPENKSNKESKGEMFCPRCTGKGFVDSNDIKRLGKERTWSPGVCGYCKGTGFVERGIVKYRDPRSGETSDYSF